MENESVVENKSIAGNTGETAAPLPQEQILRSCISGYHVYALDAPPHLIYASENLCRMLGLTARELTDGCCREEGDIREDGSGEADGTRSDGDGWEEYGIRSDGGEEDGIRESGERQGSCEDGYLARVHPADRAIFEGFLKESCGREGRYTAQYRLIASSGEAIYVSDTMTCVRGENGQSLGYSVLADVTDLKNETENLKFMNDTVPCGLLRYTCEKAPRVLFADRHMLEILRIPQEAEASDPEASQELYRSNIYLMIAKESQKRFALALDSVRRLGRPLAGEVTIMRADGTKGRLFGWVTRYRNREGQEEFQSICMDVTDRHQIKQDEQTQRYLKALSGIYDIIFEFDRAAKTVCCLQANAPVFDAYLKGIPMELNRATEKWLDTFVSREDRGALRRFLFHYVLKEERFEGGPAQTSFCLMGSDGKAHPYQGLILKTGPDLTWFCCRAGMSGEKAATLELENRSLKDLNDEMKELMKRFTEGVVAFEVMDGRVKPLYLSDNAYAFFGYTQETWRQLVEERPLVKAFVSRSGVPWAKYEELFERGEAQFPYQDVKTGQMRTIRAVCSRQGDAAGDAIYIMLYNKAGDQGKPEETRRAARVLIRTFGYFDVFVDGRPIAFRNEKTKELLALLVDRKGGYVSSEEAIGYLWEDEPASPLVLARYRKVALRLKNLLGEYGISDIVETVSGKRRLVTDRVECDLYQYLSGEERFVSLFAGSYLTNYSWAEVTLGELYKAAGHGA